MSSGFITEAELTEVRKQRQDEWEKVRTPNDPIQRPEEPYDPRSLFEKLQEQKQKKDIEYEEAHKLKNMIKGLDDDEIDFLDLVDRTKLAADRKKELEEERELHDFRNRVATLHEQTLKEKLQIEKIVNKPKTAPTKMSQQQKLLKGVVIKKNVPAKRKISEDTPLKIDAKVKCQKTDISSESMENIQHNVQVVVPNSDLQCIAILPGLGYYEESSDENSSDSEIESSPLKIDILGRKITKKEEETS